MSRELCSAFVNGLKDDNIILKNFGKSICNVFTEDLTFKGLPDDTLSMNFMLSDDFINSFMRLFGNNRYDLIEDMQDRLKQLKIRAFEKSCGHEFELAAKNNDLSGAKLFKEMEAIPDMLISDSRAMAKVDQNGYFSDTLLGLAIKDSPCTTITITARDSYDNDNPAFVFVNLNMIAKDGSLYLTTLKSEYCKYEDFENPHELLNKVLNIAPDNNDYPKM